MTTLRRPCRLASPCCLYHHVYPGLLGRVSLYPRLLVVAGLRLADIRRVVPRVVAVTDMMMVVGGSSKSSLFAVVLAACTSYFGGGVVAFLP